MKARTRRKLAIVAVSVAVAVPLGSLYGALVNPDLSRGVLVGGLVALLISAPLSALHVFVLAGAAGAPVRRRPVWQQMAINLAAATGIVLAALAIGPALADRIGGGGLPVRITLADVLFSLGVSAVLVSTTTVSRVLGGEVLVGLLTGRFATPREEHRLFLTADVKGSTALAERLGDVRFHGFLNEVFSDLAEPVAAHRGRIHRYVGDEVIVTWRLRPGRPPPDALSCVCEIQATLARAARRYRERYAAAPALRFALHAGPVVTGEMGDLKREVAFLGDTVNTLARIAQAGKQLEHDVLISESARQAVAVPDDVRLQPVDAGPLRGKRESVRLWHADAGAQTTGATPAPSA